VKDPLAAASLADSPLGCEHPTLRLVEELTNDLRARWGRGERPALETYLNQQASLRNAPEAAVDLIYEEVLLREAQGEDVLASEYLERFPQYEAQIRDQFEAHKALGPCALSPFTPSELLHSLVPGGAAPIASRALPVVRGYEIECEIGRGGMGVVYRALHGSLGRCVALKMIATEELAQPQALARFQNEALAVARLQHPNIVQIYEVGEQEGRPYLALELVDGEDLAQRLGQGPQGTRIAAQLVSILARAIHYAHQQGIIHRDLKPANVLLQNANCKWGTDQSEADASRSKSVISNLRPPIPKITDFGLAKCLDIDKGFTRSGTILGTPCYMAPEQASAKTGVIGPAVDIHALGTILYELLTGRPPFQGETHVETVLQVLNDEPRPPRHLQTSLPRDLETICLKCLAKLPSQRYASAQALAEDLDRFLTGEPIHARPAAAWERAVKWTKRRPLTAALLGTSGVAVFALLLLSLIYNSRLHGHNRSLHLALQNAQEQREEAERARLEAENNFQKAMQAVNELSNLLADKDLARAPHLERKRQAFLQKALALYEDFLKAKSTSPIVRQRTAQAYGRVAGIHFLLGEQDRAEKAYCQAVDLYQQLVAEVPGNAAYRHQLGQVLHGYAALLQDRRCYGQAESLYRQALTLHQGLATDLPRVASYRHELARHHHTLGNLLRDTRRPTEAEAAYREAIMLDDKLASEFPNAPEYRQDLAKNQHHLALLNASVEPEKTKVAFAAVLEGQKQLVAEYPEVPSYRHELARYHHNLGKLLRGMGEHSEAEAAYHEAVVLHQQLAKDYPDVPTYRRELARHFYDLAHVYKSTGKLLGAKEAFKDAQVLCQKLVNEAPKEAAERQLLARTFSNLGWLAQQASQTEEAEKAYQQALAIGGNLAVEFPDRSDLQNELGQIQRRLAKLGEERLRQNLVH
jgi:serine/threonine protein kinase